MIERDLNILVIDDDLKVGDLLKIHILSIGQTYCRTVCSASEAAQFLTQEKYDVVISDMRMPDMDGIAFLTEVNDNYPDIVKVLFTGFGDLNTLQEDLTTIGVSHYISKPWQKPQLHLVMGSIFREVHNKRELNLLREELDVLSKDCDFLNTRLQQTLTGTVTTFRELVQLSSPTIGNHCRRTSILVTNLARRMGKSREFIERLQTAALIHDLSLVSYPSHIHQGVETYMSIIERQNYVKHPEICANLLGNVVEFRDIAEIVRHHHENVDGSGFYGVSGNDLPEEAKMIRICDCYDEEETYNRNAHQNTLDYMNLFKGKWFDEKIFAEFYEMMNSYKN